LGNSHGDFQLNRFTTSKNIAKSFRGGGYFFWLTLYISNKQKACEAWVGRQSSTKWTCANDAGLRQRRISVFNYDGSRSPAPCTSHTNAEGGW